MKYMEYMAADVADVRQAVFFTGFNAKFILFCHASKSAFRARSSKSMDGVGQVRRSQGSGCAWGYQTPSHGRIWHLLNVCGQSTCARSRSPLRQWWWRRMHKLISFQEISNRLFFLGGNFHCNIDYQKPALFRHICQSFSFFFRFCFPQLRTERC